MITRTVLCFFVAKINARLQLLTAEEEVFIGNLIRGIVADPTKTYLYQIVNNKGCGIDADKMDYES